MQIRVSHSSIHDCSFQIQSNSASIKAADLEEYSAFYNNDVEYTTTDTYVSNNDVIHVSDYFIVHSNRISIDSPHANMTAIDAYGCCSVFNNVIYRDFDETVDSGGHNNGMKFRCITGNSVYHTGIRSSQMDNRGGLIHGSAGVSVTRNSVYTADNNNTVGVTVNQSNSGAQGAVAVGNVVVGGLYGITSEGNGVVVIGNLVGDQQSKSITYVYYNDSDYIIANSNRTTSEIDVEGTGSIMQDNITYNTLDT